MREGTPMSNAPIHAALGSASANEAKKCWTVKVNRARVQAPMSQTYHITAMARAWIHQSMPTIHGFTSRDLQFLSGRVVCPRLLREPYQCHKAEDRNPTMIQAAWMHHSQRQYAYRQKRDSRVGLPPRLPSRVYGQRISVWC